MMKKLYYVVTNSYDMVVSVDSENNCRYLTQTEDFPANHGCEEAKEFLESIEDDNTWEDDCTYDEIFGDIDKFNEEILAEVEKKL